MLCSTLLFWHGVAIAEVRYEQNFKFTEQVESGWYVAYASHDEYIVEAQKIYFYIGTHCALN